MSGALGIPYVIAEASHSLRRAQGPWRPGHRAVERALAAADLVLTVNPNDFAGVRPRLAAPSRQVWLPPFIDVAPLRHAATTRAANRAAAARRFGLDPDVPWLLSVGMMRARDKLESYRVLGEALPLLAGRPWAALIVGDGPARGEIEALMAPLGARVAFTGALPHGQLPAFYAAADLYLWPAINEAYGMAFLEAQAAGLPVVAGRTGGVPAVVAEDETGLLTPVGDARAFAAAVGRLLDDPARRAELAAAAAARVAARHDESAAARALKAAFAAMMAAAAMSAVPFALLRHAPTVWNEAGRLQGLTDTALSAAGEAAARRWRLPVPADRWRRLASPLGRARRTAELIRPAAAVTVESRLREMSFGEWEGRTLADLRATRRRGL